MVAKKAVYLVGKKVEKMVVRKVELMVELWENKKAV